MNFINRIIIASIFLAYSTLSSAVQLYQPGNILVSTQNTVFEYNSTDNILISQTTIPVTINNEPARDIIILEDGRLAVYNGTFYPELAIYDGISWRSITVPGWSTVNNGTYGGIASIGTTVYVTDNSTFGNEDKGLIAIDVDTGTSNRFISDKEYIDITLGKDGLLYALSNTYGALDVVDPVTLTRLHSVSLGHTSSSRATTANSNGDIFMASWGGYIAHHDAIGTLLNSLTISNDLYDIDLDDSGRIVVGSRFGKVFITDKNLATFSEITASTTGTFATFVPSPQALPISPPVLSGTHTRKGKWITTNLRWTTEASAVDIYYNGQLLETVNNATSVTYVRSKFENQVYTVCNAATEDCSTPYTSN